MTFVTTGRAYSGFELNEFEPQRPPNPRCCSNPRYLCGRCAVKALDAAGITANQAAPAKPRWKMIDEIIENCECENEREDRAVLSALDHDELEWAHEFVMNCGLTSNAQRPRKPEPLGQPQWDWDALAAGNDPVANEAPPPLGPHDWQGMFEYDAAMARKRPAEAQPAASHAPVNNGPVGGCLGQPTWDW